MISLKSNLFKLVFALFALIATISFQGCGEDDAEPPTITFDGGTGYTAADVTKAGGSQIIVKVTINKGTTKKSEDLKTYKITVKEDGSSTAGEVVTRTLTGASGTFTDTLEIRSVGQTDEFIFYAEDKGGKTATRSIKVTIGGDAATPSITLSDADGAFVSDETVDVGTSLLFKPTFAKGSTGQNIKTWKVTAAKNGGAESVIPQGENASPLNVESVSPPIPAITATEGTWVFRFYATSIDDKSAPTKAITITVGNSQGGASSKWTAVLLGAQNANDPSSLSTSDGSRYNITDAKTNSNKVDIMYFYTDLQKVTFGAPSDNSIQTVFPSVTSWTTKNATQFKKTTMTKSEFDALNGDDAAGAVRAAFDGGSATANGTRVNEAADNMGSGKVVAFKTEAGKSGIFYIGTVVPGASGSAKIEVIVED